VGAAGPLLPKRDDDGGWPLLAGERRVRFICGALLGVASGCGLSSQMGSGKAATVLWMILTAVAFGAAAALLGDKFWQGPRLPRDW
jgi:hypothetical protein